MKMAVRLPEAGEAMEWIENRMEQQVTVLEICLAETGIQLAQSTKLIL